MERLSELKTGETGLIVKILGHGAFRKRVMEMGFVKGREVKVILSAPLRDPIKYELMGYEVSLRRSEASLIEVVTIAETTDEGREPQPHTTDTHIDTDTPPAAIPGAAPDAEPEIKRIADIRAEQEVSERTHHINVALIGNPTCGKTSLFNALTGSSEHVGNYSGVTVDAKKGSAKYKGYTFEMVDLPGTYSLASYSPEELYVRKYLRDETPDVIINVVDASNIERNMYLTTELIDTDRSMVIALNMFDELQAQGTILDYPLLGRMIGVPIVPTVAKRDKGLKQLLETVIAVFEGTDPQVRHVHVPLGTTVEKAVTILKDDIKADGRIGHRESPRYLAIKLLEGDAETERYVQDKIGDDRLLAIRDQQAATVEKELHSDITEIIAAEKYGFISGALTETMRRGQVTGESPTDVIDTVVTNKLFGFPLFFLVMIAMFWLTFTVGQYPMDWIQNGVDALSGFIQDKMSDGPLKDLIADGVIGGVGGVIVFLPNILILYFCISFMEDSGYMARAAFIMDKVMHHIGVHGKSFIPLVMGFGCNVPAIMATRTIESKSSRLITILINPFMSCSARIPIYVLLAGTFFPEHPTLMFSVLYFTGILVAVITARLLRRFWFRKDETPFVMELPPYRMPTLRNSLRHMWDKGYQYLQKMGGIILVASIIVWALNYFPRPNDEQSAEQQTGTEQSAGLQAGTEQATETDSYLAMAGKAINPVMEPLGFNWRSSVAALAGVPAKEIVVSTLGVLYTGDEAVSDQSLGERLKATDPTTGQPGFTWASALAFMIFILLYCPCIATLTAIYRETGSWRYPAFSIVYNTVVAWLLAAAVYQLCILLM